jgi:hypothetical protein
MFSSESGGEKLERASVQSMRWVALEVFLFNKSQDLHGRSFWSALPLV